MAGFSAEELSQDDFLGGRVRLLQPRQGYRAGVDPVLLAAAVPARSGMRVLELGCGGGQALLCLAARVPGLDLTGVEVQADYADLARRNLPGAAVVTADLRDLPGGIRTRQFHHVIMNPPYFDRTRGDGAADPGRDLGRAGDTPVGDWLDVGIRRLAPKGHLTLIQHISRLPEVLAAVAGRLGSVVLCPLQPREGRAATLFLVQARQGGRAPFAMRAPLILHEGARHEADREHYTPQLRAILRDAHPLDLSD